MHALRHQCDEHRVAVVEFVLSHSFFFGICLDCKFGVYKRFAQRLCALSALTLVCLVDDDRELTPLHIVKVFVREQELLDRTDDDTFAVVDRLYQTLRVLLLVDRFDQSRGVVKAVDRILQLIVEHYAVGDHDDRIENRFVVLVVERREAICYPRDGIGLAASCGMLDEIVFADSVLEHFADDLAHDVQLMEPGEDQLVLFDDLDRAVLFDLALFGHKSNELVEQFHETVAAKHLFPKIGGDVFAVLGLRIAFASRIARAVAALVERHKARLAVRERGGHIRLIKIYGEVCQKAVVEFEAKLLAVAVGAILFHRVVDVLPHVLILEFERDQGEAVERQDHVDRVVVLRRIGELTRAPQDVAAIQFRLRRVELGHGLEIAQIDLDAHVLNAVFERVDQAVVFDRLLDAMIEPVLCFVLVVILILAPRLGLSLCDKVDQDVEIDRPFLVIVKFVDAMTVGVEVGELLIPSVGDQPIFDVAFKLFFCQVH